MDINKQMPALSSEKLFQQWGFWSVLLGGLALIVVTCSIYTPSLEPKPSLGTQLGQIVKDFNQSRRVGATEAVPEEGLNFKSVLYFSGPALGAVAIFLSLISLVKKEDRNFSLYGTGMGASAILIQFVFLIAVLILGGMIIIKFLDSPLSTFFDD